VAQPKRLSQNVFWFHEVSKMRQAQLVIAWVVNVALYVALLDAAIETFMAGSPVRWIAATVVAAYAAVTALAWKRIPVAQKILASLVVLEILTAYSGWKLGSLDAPRGLVVAQQSPAVVGAALLCAIFLLAAVALIFIRPLDLRLRLPAVVLCLYLILPFVAAMRGGSGVGAALAGVSAPLAHPFWLRGAYLMVEVALPLLLVASVVTATLLAVRRRPGLTNVLGIALAVLFAIQIGAYEAGVRSLPTIVAFEHPQPPQASACNGGPPTAMDVVAPGGEYLNQMGTGSNSGNQIGSVLGGGSQTPAAAATPCATASEPGNDESAAATAAPQAAPGATRISAAELTDDLKQVIDDLQASDARAPRDSFDPEAVVDRVGRDPINLFEWVRDNTDLVPYQGSLRGPVGVLMDRVGSSLDRALLLAQLEQLGGQQVRLARVRLSESEARGLLTAMQQALPAPTPASPAANAQSPGAATSDPQADAVVDAWEHSANQRQDALEAQVTMLESLVPDSRQTDMSVQNEELAAIEDHWWVQVKNGGTWSDFDPSEKTAAPGKALATPLSTMSTQQVDPNLFHQLAIRIVIESWHDNRFSEDVALDYHLRLSETIGQPIALTFVSTNALDTGAPNSGKPLADEIKARAIAVKQWQPVLRVGNQTISQAAFTDTGEIAGKPRTGPGSSPGELTAVWLDFELRSPGMQPRVIRRRVMDIRGPSARTSARPITTAISDSVRLKRGLALLSQIQVLPVVSDMSPGFVLHESTRVLSTNRDLLLRVTSAGRSASQADLTSAANALNSVPAALYAWALERQTLSPVRAERYLDRPNVLSSFTRPGIKQNRLVSQETLDIANNEIAVRPGATDPNRVRLEQGVADTFAEQAAFPDAKKGENTADLFGADGAQGNKPIVVFRSGDPSLQTLHIDPDVLARIEEDLATGYAVVVPSQPVELDGKKRFAWWRVDPISGGSVGVMDTGYNQEMTEHDTLISKTEISPGTNSPCNFSTVGGVEGEFLRGLYYDLDATLIGQQRLGYSGAKTLAQKIDIMEKLNKFC
jgi:hypothetical protein